MAVKDPENNKNSGINKNKAYIPSDYKHVQAVLQEATERTLERLLGKDWRKIINKELLIRKDETEE